MEVSKPKINVKRFSRSKNIEPTAEEPGIIEKKHEEEKRK